MDNEKDKLILIEGVIGRYLHALRTRPQLLGTMQEIQGMFWVADAILLILRHGESQEYHLLSFDRFLRFKCLTEGVTCTIGNILESTGHGFNKLRELREEYLGWVDMMIAHKINPSGSLLCQQMKSMGRKELVELLPWLSKYPSKEAVSIYYQIITDGYVKDQDVSLGLAKMGDQKIIDWSIKQLTNTELNSSKRLALRCISSSRLIKADIVLRDIIKNEDVTELLVCVEAFADSQNSNKYSIIEDIIKKNITDLNLRFEIKNVLNFLVNDNEKKALSLLEMLNNS